MKTIKVNIFDESSIDRAIDELKKCSKDVKSKAERIADELARIGAKVVDDNYRKSHEEDYVVYYLTQQDIGKSKCLIVAEGENVMFLEFGTGVYTDDFSDEFEHDTLPPIFGGSWSQSEGMGHFRPDHQFWYYNRHKYEGTLPMMGFYFATKEMKEQAENIVRKEFSR